MNRFLAIVVLWNVLYVNANNEVPNIQINVLQSGGFKACVPDAEGMTRFSFYGNINKGLQHLAKSSYKGDITVPTNGIWCYVNRQRQILNGDVLNYRYEVTTKTSHHLSTAVSFVFTDVYGSDVEVTTKAPNNQDNIASIEPSGPFDFFLRLDPHSSTYINIEVNVNDLINNLRQLINPSVTNCSNLLELSKNSIRDLISYNSDQQSQYQDTKEDLAAAKKSISQYKQMLVETFRIIEFSHKNKSNKLRLETNFMMLDGYVNHIIPNELRLTEKDYSIVRTQRLSNNATEFEVDTYGHKLNIFLTSRVKLKGNKVKMFDPDFE